MDRPSTPPPKEPRKEVKKQMSPHTRTRIAIAYRSGVPASQVAKNEGISTSSVYGVNRRYDHQVSAKSRPRTGRPQKLDDRDKRIIRRTLTVDPSAPLRVLVEAIDSRVSGVTIKRWMRKEGIVRGPDGEAKVVAARPTGKKA
ncbi:hypothetical protein F5X68DRAFT_243978 [Plectosphaerella plurivora]|uniref:Transposase n=1 Tax=Plectosphaerella plurivora TaxID=936078 RepID=A0A9P9AHE4_9PEZI|nr:hypothetical protein F5X68DRAFT_243978 [Plectosphaerella plurivora]